MIKKKNGSNFKNKYLHLSLCILRSFLLNILDAFLLVDIVRKGV